MLEDVPDLDASDAVFRLANSRNPVEIARQMGLDEQAVDELLDFLGPASRTISPEDLLHSPFASKDQLKLPATRFSDGTWPVFYSAIETETTESEVGHHLVVDGLLGTNRFGRTIYYSLLRCVFSGRAKDLRSKLAMWPELIDQKTVNPRCQALGREAHDKGVEAFYAPSARRHGATTVPVFKPGCLSKAEIVRDVAFTLDATTALLRVTPIMTAGSR